MVVKKGTINAIEDYLVIQITRWRRSAFRSSSGSRPLGPEVMLLASRLMTQAHMVCVCVTSDYRMWKAYSRYIEESGPN